MPALKGGDPDRSPLGWCLSAGGKGEQSRAHDRAPQGNLGLAGPGIAQISGCLD
jgi:hypothetical protein